MRFKASNLYNIACFSYAKKLSIGALEPHIREQFKAKVFDESRLFKT